MKTILTALLATACLAGPAMAQEPSNYIKIAAGMVLANEHCGTTFSPVTILTTARVSYPSATSEQVMMMIASEMVTLQKELPIGNNLEQLCKAARDLDEQF